TIPAGEVVSVERETFPGLIAAGETVMGYPEQAYWLDVGTPAAFVRGSCDVVLGKLDTGALPAPPGPKLVLDRASVSRHAKVYGGTTVGADAVIEEGATVEGSVVFDDAVIANGATVRNSVVGRGARVGSGAVLDSVILGG